MQESPKRRKIPNSNSKKSNNFLERQVKYQQKSEMFIRMEREIYMERAKYRY